MVRRDAYTASPNLLKKRVTFSAINDVAYIYSWAPVKYFLHGKYTHEQLKRIRKQSENAKQLPPILKRRPTDESENPSKSRFPGEGLPGLLHGIINSPPALEEIKFEETTNHFLPNVAIFSPSHDKDVTTNNHCKTGGNVYKSSSFPTCASHIKHNDRHERRDQCLPQLPSPNVSDVIIGCISKPKKNEVGCSDNDFMYKTPTKKPPIFSAISTRYAITEPDLHDVFDLNEENFELSSDKRQHSGVVLPFVNTKNVDVKTTRKKTGDQMKFPSSFDTKKRRKIRKSKIGRVYTSDFTREVDTSRNGTMFTFKDHFSDRSKP